MNFQAISLQNHPEWSMIRIKAPESDARTPVHLCCVIDVSASMGTEYKLENVKSSLGFLLDFLGANDTVSIVTFSDKAKVIVNRVRVTNDEKENIRARISLINTVSNTNLSDGIIAAHECLDINTDIVKQGVLLLTDGVANLGVTRTPELLELVRATVNKFPGTTISCIGYGTDHNVDLLRSISAESGGTYYVVNNLEDVAAVFGDVLGALVSCSYQRLRIVLPGGTEVKTRYGVERIAANDGGSVEVIIGDLPAGMEAVVLARAAAGTQIGMKGFDLQIHSTFAMGCVVTTVDAEEVQTAGEAHYLRFEVLELVEGVRALLANVATTRERFEEEVVRIDACITRITEHSTAHAHTLWDVLLEELRTCKTMIQTHRRGDRETTQVLGQRTMYLANMRGIAATCSVRGTASTGGTGGVDDDDERSGGTIPTSPRLRHTFSNAVQQTISSQLQTTCTPISLARRDYTTPVRLPVRNSSSMMRTTDPTGTVNSDSDGDDDLMSYLYTVSTAPCAAMPPLPKLTSEPSCVPSSSWGEGSGDIKRVTINLNASNATLSPPASPLRRAAGGAGASYAADKENEADEDVD
jgi:Mg-chelatase subunit ChlD